MDVLNEREKMVLELIMERYIDSAEPISSGTIAKTIRTGLVQLLYEMLWQTLKNKDSYTNPML